jgi:signal transduction histidine kinase
VAGSSLKKSLRSIMYGRLVLCALLCGLVASACVYFAAETLFTGIYAEARESNVREAEDRLALFDLTLARVERDSFANGRLALLELGRRYPTASRIASSSRASLEAEARGLGVSEVYFIDGGGRVAATSFAPDLGLELSRIDAGFAGFLKGLYGTAEIADQRLSQSTLTGTINNYQYFSPRGSQYIIEVSTRLDDAVARSFPGLGYDDLVGMAFGGLGSSGPAPLARIVDLVEVQGISTWSLFQRKVDGSQYASLLARAGKGGETVDYGAASMTMVKPIRIPRGGRGIGDGTYFAVFEFDLKPLFRFRLAALASALAACGLAVGIAFAAMKRSFDRGVAARIESLRAGIARAAEGDYGDRFESYGDDEIGAIGASVGSMVRTMLDEEQRLSAAARMETVGAMAGGLAHDFSNVLTGISGTIECMELRLAEGGARPEELLAMTAQASRTAKRGEQLVRALFDLAETRPSEGGPVDLSAIAREAAELSGGKGSEGVTVRVETPGPPLLVRGDGQAILRAALNLCVNGIQAMTAMRPAGERRGGLLLVRAEARPGGGDRPDEAAIVVKDEGVGIAPEERGKIFAPFYSTKPRGLGSGIGLAVALSVAEGHGGRLEMESEQGRGSAFALVLPA